MPTCQHSSAKAHPAPILPSFSRFRRIRPVHYQGGLSVGRDEPRRAALRIETSRQHGGLDVGWSHPRHVATMQPEVDLCVHSSKVVPACENTSISTRRRWGLSLDRREAADRSWECIGLTRSQGRVRAACGRNSSSGIEAGAGRSRRATALAATTWNATPAGSLCGRIAGQSDQVADASDRQKVGSASIHLCCGPFVPG